MHPDGYIVLVNQKKKSKQQNSIDLANTLKLPVVKGICNP